MRLLVPLAVMFALASAAPAADDAAEAKAIVEKAIKARGDKPGDKHTAMTWKEKGTLGMGKVLELLYTADCAFQAPDKFRQTTTISFGDAKGHGTTVINGENAWQDEAEEVKKLTGGGLARAQNGVYQFWVTSLTSLVTEKGFTLAIAKGKDVDKKPTVGVTVIRDKKPVTTLYFDRESGLLVKLEMTVKDGLEEGKELLWEVYFSDYKEADGKKHFTKRKHVSNGKTVMEYTLFDHTTAEKLDAKLFEKP